MKTRTLAASIASFVAILIVGAGTAGSTATSKDRDATLVGTSSTSYLAQTIEGTFEGNLAEGTYAGTLTLGAPYLNEYDTCNGPVCQDVEGTITFSTKKGDFTASVQPGGIVGLEDTASHSSRYFDLGLKVVSGTRGYTHARGELTLSYVATWMRYYDSQTGQRITIQSDSGTLTGRVR